MRFSLYFIANAWDTQTVVSERKSICNCFRISILRNDGHPPFVMVL